jgi:hypothetical protein
MQQPFWTDLCRLLVRAAPLLVACAGLQLLATAQLSRSAAPWVILPLGVIVTYFLYRIALLDLPPPYLSRFTRSQHAQPPAEAFGRFVVALVVIFLPPFLVMELLSRLALPDLGRADTLLVMLVAGTLWLMLSVLGTLLPAAAAGAPLRPKATVRAMQHLWKGVAIQLFVATVFAVLALSIIIDRGFRLIDSLSAAPPLHVTIGVLLTAGAWATLVPVL